MVFLHTLPRSQHLISTREYTLYCVRIETSFVIASLKVQLEARERRFKTILRWFLVFKTTNFSSYGSTPLVKQKSAMDWTFKTLVRCWPELCCSCRTIFHTLRVCVNLVSVFFRVSTMPLQRHRAQLHTEAMKLQTSARFQVNCRCVLFLVRTQHRLGESGLGSALLSRCSLSLHSSAADVQEELVSFKLGNY